MIERRMHKKIKHNVLALLAVGLVAMSVVPAQFASAACPSDFPDCPTPAPPAPPTPPTSSCPQRVFTFPTWYRGVPISASCDFKPTKITDLIKIPINILEMLIQAVAYAAAGYILWGGFKYMKSQGDPSKISEAKTAIINALTGLGIALASVAIVEFIQGAVL